VYEAGTSQVKDAVLATGSHNILIHAAVAMKTVMFFLLPPSLLVCIDVLVIMLVIYQS
jgi:hypothetical protein